MTVHPEISARIAAGRQAVLAQTELLHREFGRARSHWKADGTRVTTTDLEISKSIFAALETQFADDQFFSEESAQLGAPIAVTTRFSWLLDPIDGTNNFALGIPHCAIGLALLQDGEPIYGFVYDSARRVLIHGGPGFGVWDGGHPAQRTGLPLERQSVVGFHSPYDTAYAAHAAILTNHFKIRSLGTSTIHLAYVGIGLFDAVVDHNVKVWDIAAAVPLVLAAGGVVDYISPSPFPLREFDLQMGRIFYVAGDPTVIPQLRALLGV
ncbi:MAG: inositol monophosphatase [Cephaloticoccus sp.]|nr:inositol monophosphatase [Cephaloticoccus sp.]MCF7759896.1 inositol monophosphatase [Cephaloticoccus sp.]